MLTLEECIYIGVRIELELELLCNNSKWVVWPGNPTQNITFMFQETPHRTDQSPLTVGFIYSK